MCGRYTLKTSIDVVAEHFGLDEHTSSLTPSYNVAPTQEVAAVIEEDDERKLEMFRWGLIPSWAKDPAIGNKLINARAETVAEKPSFRSAFKRKRCLIVADGFYEWQKAGDGAKQPFYFRMKNSSPFAFAGLWETWDGHGERIRSCSIITTDANDLMREIHHRMPVILPAENYAAWLDPGFEEKEALLDFLRPYPSEEMEAYPVSRRVNRPSNNEPGVVEPAA